MNVHLAISIVLDGLDFNLPATHARTWASAAHIGRMAQKTVSITRREESASRARSKVASGEADGQGRCRTWRPHGGTGAGLI